jgi:acyl-CoA synthetase (AMP-forming)/AMP-acid ligase II
MQGDAGVRSVFEAFRASARLYAERPFLREPPDAMRQRAAAAAASWTYGAAAAEVDRLQLRYAAGGPGPGRRVALTAGSTVDVYLHLLALNGLEMSLVPVDMNGSDAEIAFVLRHSDSMLVVSTREQVGRLRRITRDIAGCRAVTPDELAPHAAREVQPAAGNTGREAALLYTSGTTGKPKGCMLSNDYFLTMGRWYNSLSGRYALTSDDRLLTPLPPNHMNALCVSFMAMITCGGCIVQLDRFHPSSWWDTVQSEGATIIHYLGVMPAILLSLPAGEYEDFGMQVKFGFGAGVDPPHQGRFERRFGFPLLEAWAMTETGAGAAIIADCEPRHVGQRCIGRPSPETEYRIIDDTERDVAAGESGELLVRRKGRNFRKGFFSGYYKDEDATREAWRGGWFHTGDVVRAGPDGSLFFVDRRKNVIRRSGENISAVEVEATLLTHPDVANCAVTAVPDELRGDEVFAFIVPAADAATDRAAAAGVLEHCLEHLSYFKVPGYVAYVDELPLTASQKVSRKELKSAASACLATTACFDFRNVKKRRNRKAG